MAKVKGYYKLTCVQGRRKIVSWSNVWERVYRSYRLATVKGWDYVELQRAVDGLVLYSDGTKPDWLQ